jgi:hypothetical protein
MKAMFAAKSIFGFIAAAALTGTMFAGFDQATSSVPAQWPISINATAQPVQNAA